MCEKCFSTVLSHLIPDEVSLVGGEKASHRDIQIRIAHPDASEIILAINAFKRIKDLGNLLIAVAVVISQRMEELDDC